MNEELHTSDSSQNREFESIRQLKELLSKPVGAQNCMVIIKICIESTEKC